MYVALFSFLGVVIGAALQFFFTRHLDTVRAHREARTKAYTDYLRAVSEAANPNQMISSDGHEANARIADAKCRICLYGSREVIAAFATFEQSGAALHSMEQQKVFTDLVRRMRNDSIGKVDVAPEEIQLLLTGSNPNAT